MGSLLLVQACLWLLSESDLVEPNLFQNWLRTETADRRSVQVIEETIFEEVLYIG